MLDAIVGARTPVIKPQGTAFEPLAGLSTLIGPSFEAPGVTIFMAGADDHA